LAYASSPGFRTILNYIHAHVLLQEGSKKLVYYIWAMAKAAWFDPAAATENTILGQQAQSKNHTHRLFLQRRRNSANIVEKYIKNLF
jgi:hypothetical protein